MSVVCTLSVTPEAEPDDFTISLRSVSAQAGGRMESLSGQSMIWDSQTFVLVGWGAPETDSPTKVLAVFITPKIIDTAGNRVNTDEAVYNNARRYSPPPKDD